MADPNKQALELVEKILERGRLYQKELQGEIGVKDGGIETAKKYYASRITNLIEYQNPENTKQEAENKPDARNFRVDRNQPATELIGVIGNEERSLNEE